MSFAARAIALIAGGLSGLLGCTVRYSHVLVERVSAVRPGIVMSRDSGTEIGAGFAGLSPRVITISEPTPSQALAQPPCETGLTEVDYRGTWAGLFLPFPLWPIASFPAVEVRSYCEPEPVPAP